MDDVDALEAALANLGPAAEIDVREDGERLAELCPPQWEIRRKGSALLFHVWSGERNLVRRVTRLLRADDGVVTLEVMRFGRSRPGKLEFLRRDSQRAPGRLTREKFRDQFSRLLAEKFPDATIESLAASPDLEHSLSGIYPRGILKEAGCTWTVLGVSASESAAVVDGGLAFGLLWLDYVRHHPNPRVVMGLRLVLPSGAASTTKRRASFLQSSAGLQLYEYAKNTGTLEHLDLADTGNLDLRILSRPELEARLALAKSTIEEIRALVPEAAEVIQASPLPGKQEIALRFRGVDFARWTAEGTRFGIDENLDVLTTGRRPKLAKLLRELVQLRSPAAKETAHRFYRAAPERWLETLLSAEPERLDAALDPRHLYSQVSAVAAGDRGIVDLVGVTLRGRLVVIELKASEDIQLPMQALDYWQRVRHHQMNGDFHRAGYFTRVELDPRPPLLWLVAPGFQFHPSTDILLRYISPEIEITRIGLNENWRLGIRVIFRC